MTYIGAAVAAGHAGSKRTGKTTPFSIPDSAPRMSEFDSPRDLGSKLREFRPLQR